MPFATTWMDFEGIMLREISQREKDRHRILSLRCGIQNKNKNQAHRFREQTAGCQRQVGEGCWGKMGEGHQKL